MKVSKKRESGVGVEVVASDIWKVEGASSTNHVSEETTSKVEKLKLMILMKNCNWNVLIPFDLSKN